MKTIKPSWSLIGLVGAAFTIITAGIGLIQARISTVAIIYGNAAQASNNTALALADARLEQQSNLYQPLGMFLVTLGLAMLFSTGVWMGIFSLASSQVSEGEKLLGTRLVTNIALASLAIVLLTLSYFLSMQVRLAANNLWKAVIGHPSFIVGFTVLSMLFYALLDIVTRKLILESD